MDAMAGGQIGTSLGPAGPTHRLDIALYSDTVPRTAENFRRLCVGDGRLSYKRSLVHKARGTRVQVNVHLMEIHHPL
eukprot:Skav206421  [mRNA]  locus=scaffold292:389399:389629:+ [translate_table: standard]